MPCHIFYLLFCFPSVEKEAKNKQQGSSSSSRSSESDSQSSDTDDKKRRRRKRKKVRATDGTSSGGGQGRGGNNRNDRRGGNQGNHTRGNRKSDQPTEVTQKEIDDKIRATMARISGGGKRRRQKIRRENRERLREKQDLIDQEKETEVVQLTEVVTVS